MKILTFIGFSFLISGLSAQKYWNTSAKFDGKSYLAVSEAVLKESRPKMTIEFWIKPDIDSSSETIFGNKQFWILTEKGKIRFEGNGANIMSSSSLLKGKIWTHVAAVYDGGAGTALIYINGVLDKAGARSGTLIGQVDSFVVGKKYYNNFTGEIDELRIWRVARTASEISNNYKTHISPWYVDDIYSYGNLAYVQSYEKEFSDSGFFVPNAKITGSIVGNVLGLTPSQTVKHNNSVFFSGSSFSYLQTINAADPHLSINGELTIEAWVNPSSFDTRMVIMDLTGGGGGGGFQFATGNDGKLNFTIQPQSAITSMSLLPNTWYHLAVVVDSSSISTSRARIYVNGNLTNTSTHNKLAKNTGFLRIGASHSNTDYFKGYMDEVRISNYAKTEIELAENMYTPICKSNEPMFPKYTIAYNFDGGYYSSTGKGYRLENENSTCRFTYFNEPIAPLFSLGTKHKNVIKKFHTVQRAAFIPEYGSTQGIVVDTLHFDKALKVDGKSFKVFLSLAHQKISDLKIELFSPSSESVELINQISSISGNQITLVLDSQQQKKINNSVFVDHAPLIGFNGTFNTFNGLNSKGVWTLKVSDLTLGNTGRLYSWGISAEGDSIKPSGINKKSPTAIKIYPNPINYGTDLMVKCTDFANETLLASIYNSFGNLVQQQSVQSKNGTLVVELKQKYLPGIYFLHIQNTDVSYFSKFLLVND